MLLKKGTARMAVFCGLASIMATVPLVGCGGSESEVTPQITNETTSVDTSSSSEKPSDKGWTTDQSSPSQTTGASISAKDLFAEMRKAEKSDNYHLGMTFDITGESAKPEESMSTKLEADVSGKKAHTNMTMNFLGINATSERYTEIISPSTADVYELSSTGNYGDVDGTKADGVWRYYTAQDDTPWADTISGFADVDIPDSAIALETTNGWQVVLEGDDVKAFMDLAGESMSSGGSSGGEADTVDSTDLYGNWKMLMDVDKDYHMTRLEITADATVDKQTSNISIIMTVDGFDTIKDADVTAPDKVKSSAVAATEDEVITLDDATSPVSTENSTSSSNDTV